MRAYVSLDNFTTKPRFQSRNLYILPRTKSQTAKMKRIFTCNTREDENNLVQTRLGGEFWTSNVVIRKAHFICQCFIKLTHGVTPSYRNCMNASALLKGISDVLKNLKVARPLGERNLRSLSLYSQKVLSGL